jgi:hypothetical protein
LQVFSWAPSARASASGRTDSGLAAARSSAVPRKRAVCRPILVRPNRSPSAGLQRSDVRPAAAVSPTPAATARSCGQRPPARYQRSRSLGASPVSVRKPRGQPRPAPATRRAMAPRAVSFLRRTAPEAAARSPPRGACVAAVTGGHRRGRRFPAASRRPRASGLGSRSSSRPGTRSSTMAASARAGEAGAAPRGIHGRGRRNDAPRSTAAEAKRVSPTSLRGCG